MNKFYMPYAEAILWLEKKKSVLSARALFRCMVENPKKSSASLPPRKAENNPEFPTFRTLISEIRNGRNVRNQCRNFRTRAFPNVGNSGIGFLNVGNSGIGFPNVGISRINLPLGRNFQIDYVRFRKFMLLD